LAGTLWPESEESRALQNLRDDLMRLRKALGLEAHRIESPTRDSLSLDLEGADVDLLEFDRGTKEGAEEELRRVVELYAGPLLEGCYEEWVSSERSLRAEQYLQALETLSEADARKGDFSSAVRFARLAESLDPLRDSTSRRLMSALAAAGDPAAAVEVYRRLRSSLLQELGAEPDPETTRLFYEIRGRGREVTTRGGVAEAGRVSALSVRAPAPSSATRPPRSLTRLIGREDAIRSIRSSLSECRLATLTGSGGVGKTRLATEIAKIAGSDFEGGAVWVDLAPLTDSSLVLPAIAAALGHGEKEAIGAELLSARINEMAGDGRLLMILDNCEQIVDAVASATEGLLQTCPSVTVLATSRERLGIPGETVWRVPSLLTPAPAALPENSPEALESMLQFSATRLFLERAIAARPGYSPADRDEVEAICSICRRLDGIPLAIELAAARVAMLAPGQIAERLDDRFALLTAGARTAMPRHKTLHALIDWSYALLTDDERALLHRLSVFVDGWTLEAAEAVFTGPLARTLDTLTSLADKSLVVVEEGSNGLRYRMLETIRDYSLEKLQEAGEEDAARNAHLAWSVQVARELSPELDGNGSEHALHQIESEMGNFRAALSWAQKPAAPFEFYLEMVALLWPYWRGHGSLYEGCVHIQTAIDRSDESDGVVRKRLLNGAWELSREFQNQRSRVLARSVPELEAEEKWSEDYERVRTALEGALAVQSRLGQRPERVLTLRCLAAVCDRQGDRISAMRYLEQATDIARELENRIYLALTLHEWGCVYIYDADYERARHLLNEAYALMRQAGGEHALGFAGNNLAQACFRLGDVDLARQLYWRGLLLFMEAQRWEGCSFGPNMDGIVWSLEGLGLTRIDKPDSALAVQLLGAAEGLRLQELEHPMYRWDQAVEAHSAILGDDAFHRALAKGRELSVEQALDQLKAVSPQDEFNVADWEAGRK
jgi:predicted ATPase/DNA-binding SARP family transcriptional activator